MRVPGFGWKGWMITSWMWPCRSWRSRIAIAACRRAPSSFSPMPSSMPGREGDLQLARLLVHPQTHLGILVRRVLVRHALAAQPRARALEHEAHRSVPGSQGAPSRPNGSGCPRWCAAACRLRRRPCRPPPGTRRCCRQTALWRSQSRCELVGLLGLVAQAEERLDAAGRHAAAHRLRHLVQRVGLRFRRVGQLGEGAVRAAIAAQVGERQEDVARHGDDVALVRAACCRSAASSRTLEHGRVAQVRTARRAAAVTCFETTRCRRLR